MDIFDKISLMIGGAAIALLIMLGCSAIVKGPVTGAQYQISLTAADAIAIGQAGYDFYEKHKEDTRSSGKIEKVVRSTDGRQFHVIIERK